jgi:hypothetical protein
VPELVSDSSAVAVEALVAQEAVISRQEQQRVVQA